MSFVPIPHVAIQIKTPNIYIIVYLHEHDRNVLFMFEITAIKITICKNSMHYYITRYLNTKQARKGNGKAK